MNHVVIWSNGARRGVETTVVVCYQRYACQIIKSKKVALSLITTRTVDKQKNKDQRDIYMYIAATYITSEILSSTDLVNAEKS